MERPITPVADHQRRALTFMLDALGLPPAPDDGALASGSSSSSTPSRHLLAENCRLRFDLTGSYQAAFLNGILWNLLNLAIAVALLRRPGTPAAHGIGDSTS